MPYNRTYAVDFATEACGVVLVPWEAEVGVVETGGFRSGLIVGKRDIDDAADGGL